MARSSAPAHFELADDIGWFRPRGQCSLVEAVERITAAVAFCQDRSIGRLLVDASGLVDVPIPTLVDRFLMIEDWAVASKGNVAVALVVRPEYIHERKFGVRVAADFGFAADVHSTEANALAWLSSR